MSSEKYIVYYASKTDMFIITKDDGTLSGKYNTDIFCRNKKMANKICRLLNEDYDKHHGNCGSCKHFQLDGMFGIWCDKDRDWESNDGDCSDWEEN